MRVLPTLTIPLLTILCALLTGCASQISTPPQTRLEVPPHAVIGVNDEQLTADYWIARARHPETLTLNSSAIAKQNERLVRTDPSVRDIEQLPTRLPASDVRTWIESLSRRPSTVLYDGQGNPVPASVLDDLEAALHLDGLPKAQRTRYGMIVRRADLRTYPTQMRVFRSRDDHDIDRFQENALFPGTPVAIVHESRDRQWWFVVSDFYAAWVEKSAVAEGNATDIFNYARKFPYLIITGATARTVFTPEVPAVSQLQLDMGVRVPVLGDWPANQPVNGQHPYSSYVIELPTRSEDGELRFVPALLPRTADVSAEYLPLNRANVLRQAFKFLGERYGWGHDYNARDCSGFVSEVYRSFDVRLPRNTRDQGVSPAFDRIAFTPADSHERRLELLRTLTVGDLIYIPGHVMMVIGHDRDMPYVIHDTTGITYRHEDRLVRVPLNGVAVTPLTPLLISEDKATIDSIYSILRIRR